MLAAGEALAQEHSYDLIHGHDWLVAQAAAALSDRLEVPYVTTIHATEHGRHQGWVQDQPQSHIHAVERWMARRADAVIVCSYYMRGHVADIFGIDERRVSVIPNGVDPAELRPTGDLARAAGQFAAPDERLVLLVGRLVYEKGFQLALDALPGVIERVGKVRFLVAGSGTHEGELRRRRPSGWGCPSTAPSSAGSATTCCIRCTASATCAWCPRSTSRSGWWRSRRWPRAAPASWPTRAACARWCRVGERVGLRFHGGDAEHLGVMIERLLVDDALRDRLVAEASEHVLRFDWEEIAQRTRGDLRCASRRLAPRRREREGHDSRCCRGHDAGRLPADAEPHPLADALVQSGRRGGERSPRRQTSSASATRELADRVDRAGARAGAPRRGAGRPGGRPSPGTTSATSSCTWRSRAPGRCCTRSTCGCSPSSSSYIVNHAEDRVIFVDEALVPLMEELAPELECVEHYVVIGDGDAVQRPARARCATRSCSAASGRRRAVRVPRARRAPGRGAVLHERHHRQPEGGAVLAPLDQPALDGHADARRHRPGARRPRAGGGADVPRQRLGAALRRGAGGRRT